MHEALRVLEKEAGGQLQISAFGACLLQLCWRLSEADLKTLFGGLTADSEGLHPAALYSFLDAALQLPFHADLLEQLETFADRSVSHSHLSVHSSTCVRVYRAHGDSNALVRDRQEILKLLKQAIMGGATFAEAACRLWRLLNAGFM
jgi:hypothetical protein